MNNRRGPSERSNDIISKEDATSPLLPAPTVGVVNNPLPPHPLRMPPTTASAAHHHLHRANPPTRPTTILYRSGRRGSPVLIHQLEPVYPWDLEDDGDDYGNNAGGLDGFGSGSAASVSRARRRRRVEGEIDEESFGEEDEEFEHPSLENRKLISF